jgi:hypothetical protein
MSVKLRLSNAFKQGKTIHLHSNKPIMIEIKQVHDKGVPYKKIAQVAQLASNIHKRHPTTHAYYAKLAKEARAIAHVKAPNEYSIKYPQEVKQAYQRQLKT